MLCRLLFLRLRPGPGKSTVMTSKLPIRIKLGYGICDLGGNLFFTVIAFLFLNYLTDTVGIAAGLAGIIVMVGKIWDAVTDPVAGYLSDNTQTRWGRRRPYIFLASIPSLADDDNHVHQSASGKSDGSFFVECGLLLPALHGVYPGQHSLQRPDPGVDPGFPRKDQPQRIPVRIRCYWHSNRGRGRPAAGQTPLPTKIQGLRSWARLSVSS